jgi:hypothetical protein
MYVLFVGVAIFRGLSLLVHITFGTRYSRLELLWTTDSDFFSSESFIYRKNFCTCKQIAMQWLAVFCMNKYEAVEKSGVTVSFY